MQIGSVLADTSALIGYFSGNSSLMFVDKLIRENMIFVNEIVLTEFLPSCVKRGEFQIAATVNAIQQVPMNINWKEIRSYQIIMLKSGYNKISIPDLLIAQNCIQNNIQIISCDKHFETIAKFLPLKLY